MWGWPYWPLPMHCGFNGIFPKNHLTLLKNSKHMLVIAILLSLFSPLRQDIHLDSFPDPRQEFWFWNQTDLPQNAATRNDALTFYLNDFRQHQGPESSFPNLFNQPVTAFFTPFSETMRQLVLGLPQRIIEDTITAQCNYWELNWS